LVEGIDGGVGEAFFVGGEVRGVVTGWNFFILVCILVGSWVFGEVRGVGLEWW
jgi:hypothetical protein